MNTRSPYRAPRPRARILAAALLVSAPLSTRALQAQEQETAWAWVHPALHPATTFTPSADYQFTSGSGEITVRRRSPSQFEVRVPGLSANFSGSVHASAHGGAHTAVVQSFGPSGSDLVINVDLYQPNGSPAANGAFTVSFRDGGDPTARQGYLWANDESNSSYTPSTAYSWNGERADPRIVRSGVGNYVVTFPGLAGGSQGERGNVIATPYGSVPGRVSVVSWSNSGADLRAFVRTTDLQGNVADRKFLLSYSQFAAAIPAAQGSGAHVWANDPTAPLYEPLPSWTDSNGSRGPVSDEVIERLGVGQYRVHLPNLAHLGSSNAQVTSYDTGRHCSIDRWWLDGCGGTNVFVNTYDAAGNPADGRFMLRYMTSHPAAQIAWCRVDPRLTSAPEWEPAAEWQYNSAGGPIRVARFTGNDSIFQVMIPDMDGEIGCVMVTPYDGNHTAVIRAMVPDGRGGYGLQVQLFTPAGGRADNAAFSVLLRRRGGLDEREGYVTYMTPTYSSTNPEFAWNGDRGTPSVVRIARGDYLVTFPGLRAQGAEYGHAQATAIGNGVRRAVVRYWTQTANDVQVRVHCRDVTGSMVDSAFSVHYNEVAAPMAPRFGSGAHVFADNPTASSYTPAANMRDSNGNVGPRDMERIDRLAPGHYRVFLPDVYPGDSNVQVSAHGVNDDHAVLLSQGAGATGAVVEVGVYDEHGVPIDGRFSLLFLNHRPISQEARNSVVGAGCNGAVLTAISRPVLCRDWQLSVGGLPTSASLAFLQLDVVNPGLSLGASAPGCTLYTGGAVTLAQPASGGPEIYAIPVPPVPALIGGSVFAQGGALVPGVNALSVVLSNGIQGRVGDA